MPSTLRRNVAPSRSPGHVDHAAVLADLGLHVRAVSAERWTSALSSAVSAQSREQVARAVDLALRD